MKKAAGFTTIEEMKSILFVTRGRGWGHARRDMLIIDSLNKEKESFDINVISEGAGYQAYHTYGYPCTEIEISDEHFDGLPNEPLQLTTAARSIRHVVESNCSCARRSSVRY